MDYANWPHAPKEGYRVGSNYLTQSLFVELNRDNDTAEPLFSLTEADSEWKGKPIPSARLIYVHSKGEHDAMCKMVGSFKQWSKLKELEWFRKEWEMWHQEWLMVQGETARTILSKQAPASTAAAKTLFDHANKNEVGRPIKKRTKRDDTSDLEGDIARVVELRSR